MVQGESDFRLVRRSLFHGLFDLLLRGLSLRALVGPRFYFVRKLPRQCLRIGAETGEGDIKGFTIQLNGERFSHKLDEAGANSPAVCILPFLSFVFTCNWWWCRLVGFFGKSLGQFLAFCIQLSKG